MSNYNLCIICQKRKGLKDELSDLTDIGKETLLKYAGLRTQPLLLGSNKRCRIVKRPLRMIPKFCQFRQIGKVEEQISSAFSKGRRAATEPSSFRYVTRAQTDRMDINKCIFCQSGKTEALRQVML
ncbi:hypothetical protein JTB14_032822 [Gonioctena quinquepunctata]|nr:hypothetical protein JTB14_032822 [Gonioctena quinquepunctata]